MGFTLYDNDRLYAFGNRVKTAALLTYRCGISPQKPAPPPPRFGTTAGPLVAWLYFLHGPRLATPLRTEARPSRVCSSPCHNRRRELFQPVLTQLLASASAF